MASGATMATSLAACTWFWMKPRERPAGKRIAPGTNNDRAALGTAAARGKNKARIPKTRSPRPRIVVSNQPNDRSEFRKVCLCILGRSDQTIELGKPLLTCRVIDNSWWPPRSSCIQDRAFQLSAGWVYRHQGSAIAGSKANSSGLDRTNLMAKYDAIAQNAILW